MTVRWGFRVASSPSAGSGHLARCLAIVQALGEPVTLFLDPDAPPDIRIGGAGGSAVREQSPTACDALSRAVAAGEVNAVLLDSYELPADIACAIHQRAFVAAFCDFQPYPAEVDLVIAPLAQEPPGPRLVSGVQYVPLAAPFVAAHAAAQARLWPAHEPPRLLVAFGTVDNPNMTGMTLTALAQIDVPTDIVVAFGANAPHLDKVCRQLDDWPSAELVVGSTDMAALYESVDLAIGAPGISMLERACCGVPSLVVCQNDRQVASARTAQASGFVHVVDGTVAAIAEGASRVLLDSDVARGLRDRGLALVDGRGGVRVASVLNREARTRV